MKKIIIFILFPFLLLSNEEISYNKYQIGSGVDIKNNVKRGIITEWDGSINDARLLTVYNTTKNLLEAESKFNCSTGGVNIDAAILDIPNELKNQMQEIFENGSDIMKEMAYQVMTEQLLDSLAGIHYNMVNEVGENGLAPFKFLQAKEVSSCLSATLSKSFESSIKGGLGFNVYDLFSGSFGINLSELTSAMECFKNNFSGTDDYSKEKFAESQRYVRMLFYKILNESTDINFNTQSETCKEWDIQKNKKDEIAMNIACKGTLIDLSGNEYRVDLIGEEVAIGIEDNSFSDRQGNEKSLSKIENESSELSDDSMFKNNIKYEAILETLPSFKKSKNKIDILDLNEEERYVFYKYILEEIKKSLSLNKNNNDPVIYNTTIELVERILSINVIDKNKKDAFLCELYKTSNYCNDTIFEEYKDMENSELQNTVINDYQNSLKSEIYNWNILASGIISLSQENQIKEDYKFLNGKNAILDKEEMKSKLLLISKNNVDKYNLLKNFFNAGSPYLFTDKLYHITDDSNKLIQYINSNYNTLNNAVYLTTPVKELNMGQLLYEYSSSVVKIKQLLASNTDGYSYIVSNENDIDNNFFYIDNYNTYILKKSDSSVYNLNMDQLELIRKNIAMIKDLYITEYSKILMSRMDVTRSWIFNFQKIGYNVNDGIRLFQKAEIQKLQLKIKQRLKLLKILKEG